MEEREDSERLSRGEVLVAVYVFLATLFLGVMVLALIRLNKDGILPDEYDSYAPLAMFSALGAIVTISILVSAGMVPRNEKSKTSPQDSAD